MMPVADPNADVDLGGKTEWRTIRFEVLEKIESLPSLSSVVMEFLELTRRDFFSAKDFEEVICKDQALVARLLKVANSGLYGRSRSIHSVSEAIVLIGLESLKKIVYAVSAQGMMKNSLKHYDYTSANGFWLHAMGVGQATRVLMDACPKCPSRGEEGFVAGLLHDVGKLAIDDFLDGARGRRVSRKAEREAVGLDHGELAEHVLKRWNLPESITMPVRYHHDYREAGQWSFQAAILKLAEGICASWGVGRSDPLDLSQDVPVEKFTDIMADLELSPSRWDQVIWDIRQSLTGLEDIFAVE